MKKFILILTFLIIVNTVNAQISQGGYPYTYADSSMHLFGEMKLKSGSDLGNYIIPSVNNADEIEYAETLRENCPSCRNDIYGKGLNLNMNFKEHAKLVSSNNGVNVWVLKFQSNEAYGLQFIFSDFQIPEASKLFFYNEDRTFLLGAFTQENNSPNRRFSTQFVMGSTIYMEYIETANPEFEGSLVLSEVVHVFKDVFRIGPFGDEDAAWCNNDAMCHSSIWDKEIRSVGLILQKVDGEYHGFGSGTLINKVGNYQDHENPYFLTANHNNRDMSNIGTPWLGDEKIENWIFLFNYQSEFCNDNSLDNSPEVLQRLMTQSVRGAEVVSRDANHNSSDFLLLKFKGNITVGNLKRYRVCYAGWEKIDDNIEFSYQFVGIHHPKGNPKKISFTGTIFNESFYEEGIYDLVYWGVVWDSGITERSSSGSPLFNNQHRIVGQLLGGFSYCEDTYYPDGTYEGGPGATDRYGKFSTSFSVGNFYQYLDPSNLYDYVDTYEPEGFADCDNNGYCEPGETPYCADCMSSNGGGNYCRITIKDDGFFALGNPNYGKIGVEGIDYSCFSHNLYYPKITGCSQIFPITCHTRKCGPFNLFNCTDCREEFDVTIWDCDENLNCYDEIKKTIYGRNWVPLSSLGKTIEPGNYYKVIPVRKFF